MNAEMFEKRLLECVDKIGGVGKACEAAGITYTTLTRWKDGTSDPKMSNILAFAKAAGVSLDWLMTGAGDQSTQIPIPPNDNGITAEQAIDTLKNLIQDSQPKLTEEENFLLSEFRALDSDQKRLMLRFLVGGFDNLNNSNNKGVFNSPNSRVSNSFTG